MFSEIVNILINRWRCSLNHWFNQREKNVQFYLTVKRGRDIFRIILHVHAQCISGGGYFQERFACTRIMCFERVIFSGAFCMNTCFSGAFCVYTYTCISGVFQVHTRSISGGGCFQMRLHVHVQCITKGGYFQGLFECTRIICISGEWYFQGCLHVHVQCFSGEGYFLGVWMYSIFQEHFACKV